MHLKSTVHSNQFLTLTLFVHDLIFIVRMLECANQMMLCPQDGVKEQNRRLASGQDVNPDIILDYPYSSYYGHRFMVTREFYGVNRTDRPDPKQPTLLDNVWMVCAWFLLEFDEVCRCFYSRPNLYVYFGSIDLHYNCLILLLLICSCNCSSPL